MTYLLAGSATVTIRSRRRMWSIRGLTSKHTRASRSFSRYSDQLKLRRAMITDTPVWMDANGGLGRQRGS